MTLRMKHRVWINTANDTDMKDLIYGPLESERLAQTDTFDQWDGAKIDLADGDNITVSLAGITNCKGIYLQMDGEVKVIINGSDTPIQLRKYATTSGVVCKLFLEGDVITFNVENPTGSGVAMAGHFHAWGKST